VIDTTVLVGGGPTLVPPAAYGFEQTVSELAAHGVFSALVASRTAASYRMDVGNNAALSLGGTHTGVRVSPVASLNPVEYFDWPSELERVLAHGAVALRFFPDVQRWSVSSEAFRAMARAVRGRCPLLIPVTRFGDAREIGQATSDLNAPVVLIGGHYTQLGDCLAALKRWPHLLLETSCLAHFRAVETVVGEVGAERVLFGSGAPVRPIQAALNQVLTADIDAADRAAILGGNASRTFRLPLEPIELPTPTRATGLVDVHAHFGALGLPTPAIAPSRHAEAVARHGIVHSVASSLRAIADDMAAGNAEAFAATTPNVHAWVVVNPNDLEGACRALDDAYRRDRVVGAKVHCGWSRQLTASAACVKLLREIARHGQPLKIHVDGPDWEVALGAVANDYRDWKVIVAHGGPGTPSLEAACLVERTDNVFVELPTSFPDMRVVREVVRRVGPERLLFGSDAPLLDPAYVLGIYADAGADLTLTASVARAVCGV
jgi:predicted TIM-barrel fold metal-dependent hydrolase